MLKPVRTARDMDSSLPPINSSDQLLLHQQKQHRRFIQPLYPRPGSEKRSTHPKPTQYEQLRQRGDEIWNRINKESYLPTELHKQYGGEAKNMVLNNYVRDLPSREATLMEKLLANRNKEWHDQQDNHTQYMRRLADERERLIGEQKHLTVKKHHLLGSKHGENVNSVVSLSQRQPDWSTSSSLAGYHGRWSSAEVIPPIRPIEEVIRETKLRLPAQEALHARRKAEYEKEWDRLYKPYKGEYGPQSYAVWQMQDYHLVRGLVDDLVENFLDQYFPPARPANIDKDMAQKLYAMERHERDKQQRGLMEARVVQLLMEELVLEVTAEMSQSLGYEMFNISAYLHNEANKLYMNIAEVHATQDENGRDESQPAYNFVTRGYKDLQNDRDKNKANVWTHTQPLTSLRPDQADLEVAEDDVEVLDFLSSSPYHLRRENLGLETRYEERMNVQRFSTYKQKEINYWQHMTASIQTIPIAARCNGIYAATMSPCQSLLAVGSWHGDVMVYDLTTVPPRPIRAAANMAGNSADDAVVDLAWNLDSSRIVTINQSGTLRVWSCVAGVEMEKKELKTLDLGADEHGIVPESLRLLLELDMENYDFRFQSGPLADMGSQEGVQGPSLAIFHPALSLLGHQDYLSVALDNGDILKCDIEEPFYDVTTITTGAQYDKTTPKIYQPKVELASGAVTVIGQNVGAELFRQHKKPLLYMGLVHNAGALVTVDQQGYINLWKYNAEYLTGYDWFRPTKRYRLDLSVYKYEALQTKHNVIYSDQSQKAKSEEEINAGQQAAEKKISAAKLGDPWHIEFVPEQGIVTYVHPPAELPVPEAGDSFHVVIRNVQTQKLSMYLTKVYRPSKLKCSRILGVRGSRDGRCIYWCLLFPASPPKEAFISLVRLDLDTMSMADWRRDIALTSEQLYQQCLLQDMVSFHVSSVLGVTGSHYIIINIAGDVSAYSVSSGQKVLKSQDPKKPQPFAGCNVNIKALNLSPTVQVTTAHCNGAMQFIFYTIDQSNKSAQNKIVVMSLQDEKDDPEERQQLWEAAVAWNPQLRQQVPVEQQVVPVQLTLHDTMHPAVYAQQLISDIVDNIVERKEGQFTDEENERHADEDRQRQYARLREEVVARRTPPPVPDAPDSVSAPPTGLPTHTRTSAR